MIAEELRFNGSDYDRANDDARLSNQYRGIFALMQDAQYRTLSEIQLATGYPQASISAQLRHMRKERFGSHTVLKRVRGDREHGLFEYSLIVNSGGCDAEKSEESEGLL